MSEIKVKKKSFFAYIAMTISFIGSCSIFQGTAGSLRWMLFYYGSPLILLLLSIYYVSLNRDIRVKKERKFFIGLFITPRIIMVLYSCVIWLISSTAFPYIYQEEYRIRCFSVQRIFVVCALHVGKRMIFLKFRLHQQ